MLATLSLAFLLLPRNLLSQENPGSDEILMLDDFEKKQAWKLSGRHRQDENAALSYSGLEITPLTSGRQYLSIVFQATRFSGLQILPERPFRIKGFVRNISVLAYGSGRSDELYLDLIDRRKNRHREFLGRLNYSGWRLLKYQPPAHVLQRAVQVNGEPSGLTLVGFYLTLSAKEPAPSRILLDDLTATVRSYFLQPELRME